MKACAERSKSSELVKQNNDMSIWSGSSSESWVDCDKLAKYRKLLKVERKAEFRKDSPD